MNSKQLISTICAVTFVSLVGLLATSSHSAPANNAEQPCVGCGLEKIGFAYTDDENVNKARLDAALAAAKEVQRRTVASATARKLAKFNSWYGTKVGVKPDITDADTLALHESVCSAFLNDPPVPAARAAVVQGFLARYQGAHRCVGYGGTVESVTPNDTGWLAVIKLGPRLMSMKAAVVGTGLMFVEEWQFGKDGSVKNLSCKATGGGIMID